MSPTLNRSSVLQCFKHRSAIEIRNGIMFDFYPGLPHMYVQVQLVYIVSLLLVSCGWPEWGREMLPHLLPADRRSRLRNER